MARYYLGGEEYVEDGPPQLALRVLVGPMLVLATVTLFTTGVALLALGQTGGTLVGLHKASFIVWIGAAGLHVLAHALKLPRSLRLRVPGAALRVSLVVATVVAGMALATVTLPAADALQDRATAGIGLDGG
jgi:hypothetical protein